MSTAEARISRPDAASAQILNDLDPSLSASALSKVEQKTEDINTLRFIFHTFPSFINCRLSGYDFGIQHFSLDRMKAIPIRTWRTPVKKNRPARGGGIFGLGAIVNATDVMGGGAVPTNSGEPEWRLQYPIESVEAVLQAYGPTSINNIGMVELASLTAISDYEKVESILLFRAIMETPFDQDSRGVDVLLEDLPAFLATTAKELLARGIERGVATTPARPEKESTAMAQVFRFDKTARRKGEKLIEEISFSVAAATDRAKNPKNGILIQTKAAREAWEHGDKINGKVALDERDYFLLHQYPSFNMDDPVARAQKAGQPVADALNESSKQTSEALVRIAEGQEAMMQSQNAILQQMAAAQDTTNKLIQLMFERDKKSADNAT